MPFVLASSRARASVFARGPSPERVWCTFHPSRGIRRVTRARVSRSSLADVARARDASVVVRIDATVETSSIARHGDDARVRRRRDRWAEGDSTGDDAANAQSESDARDSSERERRER
jgi:hypothetical protein